MIGDRSWVIGDRGEVMVKVDDKKGFKSLEIWQKAKSVAVEIYTHTNNQSFQKDFGLREQIRKSAVSIVSNIAEGDEHCTNKESIRFFYIAKGSLAELRTQWEIAYEIGYINKVDFEKIDCLLEELGKMLGSLIKYRELRLKK